MFGKFSFEYLATSLRKSPSSKSSGDFYEELSGLSIIISRCSTHVATSDESSSERRVCDDFDPEFPRSLQESDGLILDVQSEGRVFDFDGGDGVNSMCPTKGRG